MSGTVVPGVASAPATSAGSKLAVEAPFVVDGTLHGWRQAVAVSDPAAALAEIAAWCAQDPRATGTWYLNEDYSEQVTIPARIKPGLARESLRSAHLFVLAPGVAQGATMTARCGLVLPLVDLEWLSLGSGMPCEPCFLGALR